MAHEVGAGDVAPDSARGIEADALRAIGFRGENDLLRDEPIPDDLLVVIEVIKKQVERMDPLLESALDATPLDRRHNAGHEVEREDLLRAGAFSIDVERDAHLEQGVLGGLLMVEQLPFRQAGDVSDQRACRRAGLPVLPEQFVEEGPAIVIVEIHDPPATLPLVLSGSALPQGALQPALKSEARLNLQFQCQPPKSPAQGITEAGAVRFVQIPRRHSVQIFPRCQRQSSRSDSVGRILALPTERGCVRRTSRSPLECAKAVK